ncbi:copper resistance CopC family protein [Actinoplanes sp. CA-054009]
MPTAGATVTAPVTEVRISFTQPVRANYSNVKVTGPDGAGYATGDLDVFLDLNILQPVRHLAPGEYRVSWSVGVAAPGEARGEFRFTLTADFRAAGSGGPEAAPTRRAWRR